MITYMIFFQFILLEMTKTIKKGFFIFLCHGLVNMGHDRGISSLDHYVMCEQALTYHNICKTEVVELLNEYEILKYPK